MNTLVEQEHIADLVDETYAATVDPIHYDAFMESWERYIEACISARGVEKLSELQHSPVHAHFARGLQILDRLGRLRKREATAQTLAERAFGIGIVINTHGRILAANQDAIQIAKCAVSKSLRDTTIDADAVDRILAWARPSRKGDDTFLFSPCIVGKDQVSSCLLATRVQLFETLDGEKLTEPQTSVLLSSIDIRLGKPAKEALVQAFGLSLAEADVAAALAGGDAPAEIARNRGSSINTVRTQIKKILRKLDANNIPDLVRILCGFAASYRSERFQGQRPLGTRPSSSSRTAAITLPDGRKLAFVEHGAPNGQPVLFFHNMLYGTVVTDACADALKRQGWRIIAPSRPGFGRSDLNAGPKHGDLVSATARDAAHLLEHLKVTSALVLGHAAGSIYAQRFSILFPQQTDGVLFVSHAPYWRDAFMAHLPRRQRLLAKSTRYAPAALPFITRAGVALIDSGRHDMFIAALHQEVPEDMRALRRPDVYTAVVSGLHHTVRQGSAAFCLDCPLVLTDWSEEASQTEAPVRILNGAGDAVVTIDYINGYVAQRPDAKVTIIDGAGQFLLYSHWPRVIEQLGLLRAQARNKETAGTV
ncbi:MAG: alpha/beta hydrolase [Henriciella sp.]|nr:alpha/beta hydrolase [Henriciella sp.]